MIQGLLLDYGGTIDTNGLHWGYVLWQAYQRYLPTVNQADFDKAYSFGERALAIHPIIQPDHTFQDVLRLKTRQQVTFLNDMGYNLNEDAIDLIAADCAHFARETVANATPVLAQLAQQYPLVMVSNFYGNLNTVLADFGIARYFVHVIESAVAGVRKPDPQIFRLGASALQLAPDNCVVIGDSLTKDIRPGRAIGCKTIWLNVQGWSTDTPNANEADEEITNFATLPAVVAAMHQRTAV